MPSDSTPAPIRLIAAPFTAFKPTGELNLAAVKQQAQGLRESGVVGAFVAGTTGESASLTSEERMSLVEEWREHAHGLQLIVHVGSANLAEATALAKHAEAIGADAIAAVPPYYFRPTNNDDLVAAMATIAAAAPSLPFFFYHIPAMTKVELPMLPFLEAARTAIPNFAGIKFTHSDLIEYAQCVDAAGDGIEIMFGRDPLLFAAITAGCTTAVGSTYNFAAQLYLDGAAALAAGDFAAVRKAASVSRAMIDAANRQGGLAGQKALYGAFEVDCGPARPPFRKLNEESLAGLSEFAGQRFTLSFRAGVACSD